MWNKENVMQLLDCKLSDETYRINKITLGDSNGHLYINWSEIDENGNPVDYEEAIHPNWKPTIIVTKERDT